MDDSIKLISTSTNFHIVDIQRLEPKLRDMLRSYREKMKSWNPKIHSLEEAVTIRHFLGNIHLFLHEFHLAISAYSNITNQPFYKLSTLYGISIAYMQIGKFKLASDHLDMVISAEDENYSAYCINSTFRMKIFDFFKIRAVFSSKLSSRHAPKVDLQQPRRSCTKL